MTPEDFRNKEFITDLPEMLAVAGAWLDARPTIRTIYQVGDDLTVLKYHFLKTYRRYVIGAEQEAIELCQARSIEGQREELGDVTFYLLHFFRAAGLDIEEFNNLLDCHESLSDQKTTKPLFPLTRWLGKRLVLKSVRDMAENLSISHRLLFGGPMSFGDKKTDAPWLDSPDGQQWLDFKKEVGCHWMVAFGSVMNLARQMGVNMVEVVREASEKNSRNFPDIFFHPDFSWFSSDPIHGDDNDVNCCRLFREVCRRESGKTYLSLFHEEKGKEGFTPESFRVFVKTSLEEITRFPDEQGERAKILLEKIKYIEQREAD